MDFGADPAQPPPFSTFEKSCDKTAPYAFTSPLRRNEQGDDIHRFPAKLGAPFIGSVGVTAQHSLSVFGDDNKPAILSVHDVLKDSPCILVGTLRTDVRQQLTGEVT